jgi:DNA modification methylase
MKTTHKILFRNASDMEDIEDKSVDLMVTSPPYPMIAMWDEIFSSARAIALNSLCL